MKKMNKKGFTLVELLAVIVILAILMAIAATNIGPVIDNSRRSSMRTTAQQIIDAVRLQLTSNYELFPGRYEFSKGILDSGGVSAPFGGEYRYHTDGDESNGARKIGSGVYAMSAAGTDGSIASESIQQATSCNGQSNSFIIVERSGDNYKWAICLTTTGNAGGWLRATREQLDNKDDTSIFQGRAALAGTSTPTQQSGTESGN